MSERELTETETEALDSALKRSAPKVERPVDRVVIPIEVLDLVRFLAETWKSVDEFVYENCDGNALMKYPVVQGTRNQIDLAKIGRQEYSKENLRKAVDWLLQV